MSSLMRSPDAGLAGWRETRIAHLWRRIGFVVALACAAAVVLAGAASASAATIVVTSQDDGNDGTCDVPHCSLREAIVAANATDAADEIIFNDDEPITPLTPLPPITETTHIISRANGSCRADSAPLRLDGDSADFAGLVFAPGSDGSQICLVNVRGFNGGIELRSDGNASCHGRGQGQHDGPRGYPRQHPSSDRTG